MCLDFLFFYNFFDRHGWVNIKIIRRNVKQQTTQSLDFSFDCKLIKLKHDAEKQQSVTHRSDKTTKKKFKKCIVGV